MAPPGGSDGAPKGDDPFSPVMPSTSSSNSRSSTTGSKLQSAKRLTIQQLEEITDNFSNERQIGRGGYGTVYKGVHADGRNVAVKMLHGSNTGTDDGQFKHELENLMRLKHHNIVQLVGFCYETVHKPMLHEGETIVVDDLYKALCFEFMPNGSLTNHISAEYDGLDWHTRYNIIKGTCQGLKYLHEEFAEPIYHLDLKPDNILLDENMIPKLADFGSSKLFGTEHTMVFTHNFAATIGYMPPEYIFHQVVSKKFDIFSLGVVMTKIIAGPRGNSRSAELSYQDFLNEVNTNWRKRLQETWHTPEAVQAYCRQVNICTEIALSCMDDDRKRRPSILDIIRKLDENETVIEDLDPDHRWTSTRAIEMASPGGSSAAPKGENPQPSSSNSTAKSSIYTTMATKLLGAKRLSIKQLEEITNNFERQIGQGGNAIVYKGLHAGRNVAVKVPLKNTTGADDGQFETEFENLIRIEHPNIVQLVGFCFETLHNPILHDGRTIFAENICKALCLEFMPKESLKKHISVECDGLDWQTRYKIIKGTCEGLKYLHEEFIEPICHLDIKPDNILLDENMMPKLADFGSSKLLGQEQTIVIKHGFRGTRGYMPPEFINEQIVSKKFDIFSLGVVMTQIIAGPKGNFICYDLSYQDFLNQVHENWRKRLQETWDSPRPVKAYCRQVKICTKLALGCMDSDMNKRPSILDIIRKLDATQTEIQKLDQDHRWTSTMADKSKNEATSFKKKKNEIAMEPSSISIRTLQEATDNFSEQQALGKGAYGKVYRGKLENGEEIAVKLLHNNMSAINDEQFQHEFDNLMMINHPNIVRFVGYCYETQRQHVDFQGRIVFGETTYRALCFEYMRMGSLQKHLSDEFRGLGWQTRYKIIKGTCEGLKYLHEGFKDPIYHLDLKPDNILLDENMMPKLADFGFTKLFGEEQTRVTHSTAGTIGYMPPEYLFGNIVSKKLDIFSLGAVMIKIIAGPRGHTRSAEMPYQEFLDQVHENWRKRLQETSSLSDPLEAYCQQVSVCTNIALSCMELDRHKRPAILDIIHELNESESKIDKLLSYSESMRSWMVGDLVKLEAITKSKVIPSAESCDEFPVLLRVMGAPWHGAEEIQRAGVDVVVVLEVDWSMVLQWRLNIIKQALMIVIDKLGPNDRLSMLSFEGNVPRTMELTFMSDQGRDVAKRMVSELTVDHGYNIIAALREGAEILRLRPVEEANNRVGCIMFLSDNNDIQIKDKHDDSAISSEFPAYVFGLGELHHPEVMKYIADRTRGTYSFIHYDINTMKDAFEMFITGLTKITARSVKISIKAQEGVFVSSIYSGGYESHVTSDKQSGEIEVDNIYAGERKNFIVYLKVPKGNINKLVTIGGRYRSFIAGKQLANTDVFILRPRSGCSPENLAIHHEVAAELVRIRLQKGVVMAIMNRNPSTLEKLWVRVKCSEEGAGAPEETLSELGNDVAEIKRDISHNRSLSYMLSWLSCHKWQRATTKGARCVSGAFTVPGQHEDADAKDNGHD